MGKTPQTIQRLFESRGFHLGAAIVLVVCVFLVYSNTFNSSFHFDDSQAIEKNAALQDIKNLPRILTQDRGVVYATLAINHWVGGYDVTGYHVVNTTIHAISAVLVYFLLFLILKTLKKSEVWAKEIAFLAALLFTVHPIQTQAITYIIQRMESMGAMFYLAALVCFMKSASTPTRLKRGLLYAGVGIFYVLSFKSKEIYITLPVIVLLLDLYFISGPQEGLKKGLVARWPLYGALGVLLLYFAVVTVAPIAGIGNDETPAPAPQVATKGDPAPKALPPANEGGDPAPKAFRPASAGFNVETVSPKEYLLTQFNVLIYYITLLLVPANQNLDHDFPISKGLLQTPQLHEGTVFNIPIPPPIISLAILLGILGYAVYLFVRSKHEQGEKSVVSFFIFWFFIVLLPTSSFVPIIDVIYEHRLYLASVGFFVIFVIGVEQLIYFLTESRADTEKSTTGAAK